MKNRKVLEFLGSLWSTEFKILRRTTLSTQLNWIRSHKIDSESKSATFSKVVFFVNEKPKNKRRRLNKEKSTKFGVLCDSRLTQSTEKPQ